MGSQGDFSPPAHNKRASYAICCEDRSEISVSTGKEPKECTLQIKFLIGIQEFPDLEHPISTVRCFFSEPG
jgi:hypothetical protein